MTLLERYNQFYNLECSALAHGGPTTMEELQATALESMVKAFQRKYHLDPIPADEILQLATMLREQGTSWSQSLSSFSPRSSQ